MNLQVKQVGLDKPDQVRLHTYSEAGRLDSLTLYAGDHQGVLKGTRLDEVATMTVNDVVFSPAGTLTHSGSEDSLLMTGPPSTSYHQDDKLAAKVTLKDGRVLDLDATVQSPRPSLKLMNKSVHSDGPASAVQLGSQDELPDHAKLTFFVQAPVSFPRDQKIEVASADNGFSTMLRVGEGGIVLQDSQNGAGDPGSSEGIRRVGLWSAAFSSCQRCGRGRGLAAFSDPGARAAVERVEVRRGCSLVHAGGNEPVFAAAGGYRCAVGQCRHRTGRLWRHVAKRAAA